MNYEKFIVEAQNNLTIVRKRGIDWIQELVKVESGNIFPISLWWCGLVNKSSFMIDGIKDCVETKNLAVLGILLRTQIDNCLRAFALELVDSSELMILKILNGEQLNKIKDRNGKYIRDAYLVEQLSTIDDKVKTVYKSACNDVHFSKKGIIHTLHTTENKLGISIGKTRFEDMKNIEEGYFAFLHFTSLLYETMLPSWIIRRKKANSIKAK